MIRLKSSLATLCTVGLAAKSWTEASKDHPSLFGDYASFKLITREEKVVEYDTKKKACVLFQLVERLGESSIRLVS